jgi:hypothetical protein
MPLANRVLRHHRFKHSLGFPLAHVQGTIDCVFPNFQNHHGADHQHFHVKVDRVLEFKGGDENITGEMVFVALRFGDGEGLESPIPDLTAGQPIELQGEYIDQKECYKTQDNSNPVIPVLHFTHHPVGFVRYHDEFYS